MCTGGVGVESTYEKLVGTDPLAGEQMGRAVAVDGEQAAVASHASSGKGGRVQLWRRVTGMWELAQVLGPPADYDGAEFARSLAMAHGLLAVGAPDRDTVYTYQQVGSTWQAAQPVRLDDTPDADNTTQLHRGSARFGDETAVAVGDGFLLVGARHAEAVYSFTGPVGGAWRFEQRLFSSQRTTTVVHGLTYVYRAEFGCAVAVHNSTLVVGAQYEYPPERRFGPDARSGSSFAQGTGAAFIFYRNASTRPDAPWLENRITAPSSLLPGDRCAAHRTTSPPPPPGAAHPASAVLRAASAVPWPWTATRWWWARPAAWRWRRCRGTLRAGRCGCVRCPAHARAHVHSQRAPLSPPAAGLDQVRHRVRRAAHAGGQQRGA